MDFAVIESKFRFLEIKFAVQDTKLLKFFEFWKIVVLYLIDMIAAWKRHKEFISEMQFMC